MTDPGSVRAAGVPASRWSGSVDVSDPPLRPGPPVALYVHVPFCRSLCPYCDFVVVAGARAVGPRSRVPAFIRAVLAELELRADFLDATFGPPGEGGRPPLGSIYLGGGTPSLLSGAVLRTLLATIERRYGVAPDVEVTLEANPGPEELGDLAAAVAAGVTRLSLGAQSLDPSELRRLGRRHNPADVASAVRQARSAGVTSVSLDLLYDVPGQTEASWARTLEAAIGLEPDHVSLYALTLDDPEREGLTGPLGDHLPTSAGARRWRASARLEQDEDRAAAMYELADRRLAEAGQAWYELSNRARPGHESRHNLAYWRRLPHEAVGPGAHAFDGAARRWNAAALEGYLAALAPDDADQGRAGSGRPGAAERGPHLPPGGAEPLDAATARAERVILGLRLSEGVPAAWADEPPLDAAASWGLEHGLLETTQDRLRLTLRGRLLADELFARVV